MLCVLACLLVGADDPGLAFAAEVRPTLLRVCGDCHHPDDGDNHVRFLVATDLEAMTAQRGLWKSVAEQLRNRTMPPADAAQPTEAERLHLSRWIDGTLRAATPALGDYAGHVTTRRLNRTEYDHTVGDLLGVELEVSDTFPVDGSGGEGFDNNGETLFLPPLLLERYLEAAAQAADAAVVVPIRERRLEAVERTVPPDGPVRGTATVPVTGTYRLSLEIRAESAGEVSLRLDGIAAHAWPVEAGTQSRDATVRLGRGAHEITLHNGGPAVLSITRAVLADDRGVVSDGQAAAHGKLFGRPPGASPEDASADGRRVLADLARRAFRRPVGTGEVDRLVALLQRGLDRDEPYEQAMKLPLKAVLVSPHFLFRVEAAAASAGPQPLTGHELATRLSYFLWSTMPDEELFRLADQDRLRDGDVLHAQVERMLDDPRAAAFAEQFVGQWLGTHEVAARSIPEVSLFRDEFNTGLLLDMRAEPALTFAYMLAHDRPLTDLIDADYAILCDRLVRHYGLGDEKPEDGKPLKWKIHRGNRQKASPPESFRRVDLPDRTRGGVLGMAGVHLRTSYPERTSPVLRGGWVLETLLGVRVPSPPPDIPEFKRGKKNKKTVREQLLQHRADPACAACHNLMDPIGFALDNFDVLGRWRTRDGEAPIDATGTLPGGESFDGPAELKDVLLGRKDEILEHLTRKLLGYALGRSLADRDDYAIQKIAGRARAAGWSSRELVHAVVASVPFRMKSAPEPETQP